MKYFGYMVIIPFDNPPCILQPLLTLSSVVITPVLPSFVSFYQCCLDEALCLFLHLELLFQRFCPSVVEGMLNDISQVMMLNCWDFQCTLPSPCQLHISLKCEWLLRHCATSKTLSLWSTSSVFIHNQIYLVMIIPDNVQYTLYKLSLYISCLYGGNCQERKVAKMVVVVFLWLLY